jgi:hypothetical protein
MWTEAQATKEVVKAAVNGDEVKNAACHECGQLCRNRAVFGSYAGLFGGLTWLDVPND